MIQLGEIILLSYNRYDDDSDPHDPVEGDDFERIDLEILGAKVEAEYSCPHGCGTRKEYPENLIKEGTESWNKWI